VALAASVSKTIVLFVGNPVLELLASSLKRCGMVKGERSGRILGANYRDSGHCQRQQERVGAGTVSSEALIPRSFPAIPSRRRNFAH
jgi:hypothetical protein